MSDKTITRTFNGERIVTALALGIDQFEFTDCICDAIRQAVSRDGVKHVARAANANLRTVENWANKRSTPDGLHLVRLMAMVPEVQAEVRRLAAMESDLHPELQRDMQQLFQTAARIMAARDAE
jgi:hypothetical protein